MADKSLGLTDRRWLKLALELMLQPATYLHESWYETLPNGELIRRLRNEPAATALVNRQLRDILALDLESPPHEFSGWRARLALLEGPALAQLSLYLGLALRSAALRNELLGARLRRLRETLGNEAFTFALKRTPFLGAIPDFPFEPQDDDPGIRFSLIGARFSILQVAQLSEALARRMVLKLPRNWAEDISPQSNSDVLDNTPGERQDDAHLPPLLRKLIKERLPTWSPLFA